MSHLVRASPANNKMFAVAKMLNSCKIVNLTQINLEQLRSVMDVKMMSNVPLSPPSDSPGTRSTCLTFQLFKLTRTKPLSSSSSHHHDMMASVAYLII